MKNYDRAITDYDAAVNLDPKFQRAYNNRGAAWRAEGDRGRALQDYAEAVRLNPSDATAAGNYKECSAVEIERLGALPNAQACRASTVRSPSVRWKRRSVPIPSSPGSTAT